MDIASLTTPDPVTVRASATLDAAMDLMDEHGVRHLPVLDEGRFAGMISDRDLLDATGWLHLGAHDAHANAQRSVREVMRTEPVTVGPAEDLTDVLNTLLEHRRSCLPVVHGGDVVGILSVVDILGEYARACAAGDVAPEDDLTIEAFATREVHTIAPEASGDEAAAMLRQHGVRHLPVIVDDDEVLGMVSDRDIRRERGRGLLASTLVYELMTPDALTARLDERVSSVARLLAAAKIGCLVVRDGRALAGIVTPVDVLEPCARALQAIT